jgi:hypothetical protein
VIDLLAMKAHYYDGANGENVRTEEVPADHLEEAWQHRHDLIEKLAAVKCPTSGEPCIDATNAGGGVSLSPSEARKKAWPGLVSVEPLAAHAQPDGGNGSATPEASSIRTRFRSDRCSRPFACASFVPSNLDLGRTTAGFRRRRRRSVT